MVDVEKPTTTTTPTPISPPKDSDAFYAPPTSSYYFGPPTSTSAFGEPVTGTPTMHLPKEIVRCVHPPLRHAFLNLCRAIFTDI